jgi:hypothetical protein
VRFGVLGWVVAMERFSESRVVYLESFI